MGEIHVHHPAALARPFGAASIVFAATLILAFAPGAPACARGAAAGAADAAGLAPTSEPPWNPPQAIPAREPWENVLNAPLTVASVPFRLVGAGLEAGMLQVQERLLIPKLQEFVSFEPPWGVGLAPANLGERTGFGGALTLQPPPLRGWLRARLEGSTRRYGRGRAEVGPRALFASYTHDWRPQEPFFGAGMDAREDDVSDYSVRIRRAELRGRAARRAALGATLDAWAGERRAVVRRGRDASRPSLEQVFPALAAEVFDVNLDQPYAGARLVLDGRRGRPHWTHGWRVAGQAELFGHPLGGRGVLFPGRAASPGYGRTSLEAQTGFSFRRDPRTVRLSARVVDTHVHRADEPPPIFDLPALGGAQGLGGFEPGRFRGLDLVATRVAWVFPLAEHAEFELAAEAGGVFDDVWRGARLDRMRESYGVAYRLRTDRAPLAAIGLDWSAEGARVRFALGGLE